MSLLPSYLREQAYLYRLKKAKQNSKSPLWQPFPDSPQEQAYYCEADELFYGGAAGGGKTDLILGLAGTAHQKSVIFRREFPQTRAMIERSRELYNPNDNDGAKDSYNESLHIWRLASGRMVEFGAIQHEKDKEKQQGRDRDFFGWDEITQFTESQYRYVNAWNRSANKDQRCRVVATGNPPMTAEGEWVIRYWAPWLDDNHANPAQPGELRWFVTIEGKDIELETGDSFIHEGELMTPRSRTFIPARLEDNPILSATNYKANLQSLPEPMRSQLLYGDFGLSIADDAWQVLPTKWVLEAQARGREQGKPDVAQRALGVDVAWGGSDETVIAPLYGNYFDELISYQGVETDNGSKTAHLVLQAQHDNASIYIDVIGYGASAYDHLVNLNNVYVVGINNASRSKRRDKSRRYEFANVRAASYWALREALDPESGENICLPDDRRLRVDLCAPRFKIQGAKIAIESKQDIIKRIGHSPDRADAVVMAWWGVSEYTMRETIIAF